MRVQGKVFKSPVEDQLAIAVAKAGSLSVNAAASKPLMPCVPGRLEATEEQCSS